MIYTVMLIVTAEGLSFYRLPQEDRLSLAACRKGAKATFTLPLTGPYHSGGTTSSNRLAASHNDRHPWKHIMFKHSVVRIFCSTCLIDTPGSILALEGSRGRGEGVG